MADFHPAFQQANETRRWTGPLAELLPALRPEAYRLAGSDKMPGAWAWRVLPHGAAVSLRIRPDMDFRREIRIARADRPATEEGLKRWERELETFCRHFGITVLDGETPATSSLGCFHRLSEAPEDSTRGGIAARFLELRLGETQPGKARCHRCATEGRAVAVIWFPGAGLRQLCDLHAGEESQREIADVLQRRERIATSGSSSGGRPRSRSSTSRRPARTRKLPVRSR